MEEKQNGTKVPWIILRNPNIPPGPKVLLTLLMSLPQQEDGYVFLSDEMAAKCCGVCTRTIKNYRATLKKIGVINFKPGWKRKIEGSKEEKVATQYYLLPLKKWKIEIEDSFTSIQPSGKSFQKERKNLHPIRHKKNLNTDKKDAPSGSCTTGREEENNSISPSRNAEQTFTARDLVKKYKENIENA